jgi:hypothetical protein
MPVEFTRSWNDKEVERFRESWVRFVETEMQPQDAEARKRGPRAAFPDATTDRPEHGVRINHPQRFEGVLTAGDLSSSRTAVSAVMLVATSASK